MATAQTEARGAISKAGQRARGAKQEARGDWRTIGRYLAVALVVIVALGPFYWTIVTSLKTGLELNFSPPSLLQATGANRRKTGACLGPSTASSF